MCAYSNLDGTSPISPGSTGVWGVRKKHKTSDRDRRREEQDRKEKEDKMTKEIEEKLEVENQNSNENTGEQAVYGPEGKKKPATRKVDVTI